MSQSPLNIFWFIPTHGDSRYLGTSKGARAVDAGTGCGRLPLRARPLLSRF